MHRQRTHIAARMPHPRLRHAVGALERRGVVATYSIHDRLLQNRSSRRRYAERPPALDVTQRGLVDRLDADGYAVIPFVDLFSSEQWDALQTQADAFMSGTEAGLAADGADESNALKRREGKEFVVRAHSWEGVSLGADDPWFQACISDRLLGVANGYLRMWAKLSYVDLWYTVPQPRDAARVASQLWHRDFDDRHLLKAFLYLVDVDSETGPFEYVPGSQPGGRFGDLWEWKPLGVRRIDDEELQAHTTNEAVKTLAAPKGTLILCNTSGFHRGGFSTAKPRVLATATYCSPASLRALSSRNFESTPDAVSGMSGPARFAVT
jgi:hypothetical protein